MATQTRSERKQRTRRALVDAAREQIGQGELQIGALTKAAGVAHGTFYVHFESKEALLDELLDEFNGGLAAQLTPVLIADRALEDVVGDAADVFLQWWSQRRNFVAGYAQRLAAGMGVEALRDGINPPAAQLLTAAMRQRGLEHPALVAQGLLAAWMRVGLQYLFAPNVPRDAARSVLVTITLGALR